jgi:hypothetical protein
VIDRVVLSSTGHNEELSVAQFLHLPLDDRIRFILEHAVTFYQGGEIVDRQDALKYLRTVKR